MAQRMPILKKPDDFFPNPTRINVDLAAIRDASEDESRESQLRSMEAWSALNDKLVGAEE